MDFAPPRGAHSYRRLDSSLLPPMFLAWDPAPGEMSGVPHADVPAVGYRVDIGDVSIAFSSDQNGSDPAFAEFVSGVNVLVVHVATSETASGYGAALHARPSVWGQMATDAGVGKLVLSHLSRIAPRAVGNPDGDLPGFGESLSNLRSRYSGPLVIAEDLMCVPIESSGLGR